MLRSSVQIEENPHGRTESTRYEYWVVLTDDDGESSYYAWGFSMPSPDDIAHLIATIEDIASTPLFDEPFPAYVLDRVRDGLPLTRDREVRADRFVRALFDREIDGADDILREYYDDFEREAEGGPRW